MQFSKFSQYLQRLEDTSKRLEITEIIKDMIIDLDMDEIDKAMYLALGYLKAPYEDEKFNMAEKMMLKALEKAFDKNAEELNLIYADLGDLGLVAEEIASKTDNTKKDNAKVDKAANTEGTKEADISGKDSKTNADFSIRETYTKLMKIAKVEGAGSQDSKIYGAVEILKDADALSAKYITRIILGTMRLGFTEITIIDALVDYLDQTQKLQLDKDARKETKKELENIYYIHPDIGLIAKSIKENGLDSVKEIKIETGVPILPQKAQRLPSFEEIMEKMGTVWAEYKFDGTRVQLHIDKNKKTEITELEQKSLFEPLDSEDERQFIKTYTRNLDETTYQYPDIVEAAQKQLEVTSAILDGEAIGYDPETREFLPFQQIMQRKRKHNVKEMAEKVPLKYFVFDILYLDGNDLTTRPLTERKELLKKIVKNSNNVENDVILVDQYPEIKNVDELKTYFEDAREKGLEGLILKKPDAPYQAGARSYTWVKLKVADTKLLDDSVDVVVLGYYYGKGVRTQFGIGGFLAGVYDPEDGIYKSITKVGTGLTDRDWEILKNKLDRVTVKDKPKNIEIDKIYTPDVWVNPDVVVELGADEISVSQTHSLGYALRFPRLIKFRNDKKAVQSTSPEEIKEMFEMQKRGSY